MANRKKLGETSRMCEKKFIVLAGKFPAKAEKV
jgi:hypothetical protein